jgi:hypothetical protein
LSSDDNLIESRPDISYSDRLFVVFLRQMPDSADTNSTVEKTTITTEENMKRFSHSSWFVGFCSNTEIFKIDSIETIN